MLALEQAATADALFDALAQQTAAQHQPQSSTASTSIATTNTAATPSALPLTGGASHQLPTPRTSFSSGASSPPFPQASTTAAQAALALAAATDSNNHNHHHHHHHSPSSSNNLTSTMAFSSSSSSATHMPTPVPSFVSSPASIGSGSSSTPNANANANAFAPLSLHLANTNGSNYINSNQYSNGNGSVGLSPVYQHPTSSSFSYPTLRGPSPAPPTPTTNNPSSMHTYGASSSSVQSNSGSNLFSTQVNFHEQQSSMSSNSNNSNFYVDDANYNNIGSSNYYDNSYNLGGGVGAGVGGGSGMNYAGQAPLAGGAGAGGGYHHQQNSQHQQYQQQQYQQELLYEDEKEQQKKYAARSTLSAVLPPSVNLSLNKLVNTAKTVVSGGQFSNGVGLPSTRGSSNDLLGGGGSSNNEGLLAIDPSSLRGMAMKLYKASKLPLLCLLWYLSSAVTNNIGKQIMNQFRYPVTLTFVQFLFVSVFCFFSGKGLGLTTIRRPTQAIIQMTAPLVGFQVVGHVFSSIAISRVPLSMVHTIKALSPLFTVGFYRVILGTTYSHAVYMSLIPLTAGVILACQLSFEFNNMIGVLCALSSCLVFVTQNVFTKRILFSTKPKQALGGVGNKETIKVDQEEEATGSQNAQKLDKINILFYSSTMAAICMVPIWLYAEGFGLIFPDESMLQHHRASGHSGFLGVAWLLFLNGISHFFQNVFAFSVLSLTSPVTYSIASLVKRIIVIVASIVYFHQTLGRVQWAGVCMTFWGLWLYNSAKNAAKHGGGAKGATVPGLTKGGRRISGGAQSGFGLGLLDQDVDERKKKSFMGSFR